MKHHCMKKKVPLIRRGILKSGVQMAFGLSKLAGAAATLTASLGSTQDPGFSLSEYTVLGSNEVQNCLRIPMSTGTCVCISLLHNGILWREKH